ASFESIFSSNMRKISKAHGFRFEITKPVLIRVGTIDGDGFFQRCDRFHVAGQDREKALAIFRLVGGKRHDSKVARDWVVDPLVPTNQRFPYNNSDMESTGIYMSFILETKTYVDVLSEVWERSSSDWPIHFYNSSLTADQLLPDHYGLLLY